MKISGRITTARCVIAQMQKASALYFSHTESISQLRPNSHLKAIKYTPFGFF